MSTDGPGFRALHEALTTLHGDAEYTWFAPDDAVREATQGNFAGVRMYAADDPPHWHCITFGFSDLGEKASPDPELSGWGFELTCRVKRDPNVPEPPEWPYSVLANLARYITQPLAGPRWFEEGHKFDLCSSIDYERSPLTALLFVRDPSLGSLETVNGQVDFLQLVGLHPAELHAAQGWNSDGILELLRERDPLFVIDHARPSLLDDDEAVERIREGSERDGSSSVIVGEIGWGRLGSEPRVELEIDQGTAHQIAQVLPKKLENGHNLLCMGNLELKNSVLIFQAGDESSWLVDEHEDKRALVVRLAKEHVEGFVRRLLGETGIVETPHRNFRLLIRALP